MGGPVPGDLLRQVKPEEDAPTGCTGPPGDAATSTTPAKPTSAGMPTPRQHHDHNYSCRNGTADSEREGLSFPGAVASARTSSSVRLALLS